MVKDANNTVEQGEIPAGCGLETGQPAPALAAMDSLTEVVYAATTKLYQKMQAEQAAKQQVSGISSGAGSTYKKQDENVVNADYKVKEE